MRSFNRRTLLGGTVALVGASAIGAARATVRLTLRPRVPLNDIPGNYSGFSVETSQLADPEFFSPANVSFVALHRRLSSHGVLRIGGNSSEFCWWQATPGAQPPRITTPGQGRPDNWMPQGFTPITPKAVDNLRGFLDACGWQCIWGLNFGTGSPERDAEEAAYVANALDWRLQGTALDATTGITLAGAEIIPGTSNWHPRPETLSLERQFDIPRASAILLMA